MTYSLQLCPVPAANSLLCSEGAALTLRRGGLRFSGLGLDSSAPRPGSLELNKVGVSLRFDCGVTFRDDGVGPSGGGEADEQVQRSRGHQGLNPTPAQLPPAGCT